MAPAQGWHAQIENVSLFLLLFASNHFTYYLYVISEKNVIRLPPDGLSFSGIALIRRKLFVCVKLESSTFRFPIWIFRVALYVYHLLLLNLLGDYWCFLFCDLWFEGYSLRLAVFHSRIELFVSCVVPCGLRIARYTLHVARCFLSFIPCALWVMYFFFSIASWDFHVMASCFYHAVWGMIVLC